MAYIHDLYIVFIFIIVIIELFIHTKYTINNNYSFLNFDAVFVLPTRVHLHGY